jgi:2-haloacid dehalogenase
MPADALVFDLYGTLLEVGSVGRAAAGVTGDPAALVELWRQKQLEYSWLRSLMGRYEDFWAVTGDALDYSLDRLGIELDGAGRARLLDAWLDVAPYPEVPDALDAMAPRPLAVLSNGSPRMLEECLRAGGLRGRMAQVLSVDEVAIFKPHPSVYALAEKALGLPAERILFVSSNGWDVAGARSYGLPVAWVNRAGAPVERLGAAPDLVVSDLAHLARRLAE